MSSAREDTADVVLADGDSPPGETRPVVTLGGADDDLPGVLSRDADASQIDAAIRAVAAGLIVRSPDATDAGFGAMRETDGHALLTPRELEVLAALAEGMTNKAIARRLEHLAAHREIPRRIAVPEIGRAHPDRSGGESLRTPPPRDDHAVTNSARSLGVVARVLVKRKVITPHFG